MPRVIAIQHAAHEPLGTIETVLLERGLTIELVRPFAGDAVPSSLGDAAGLVLMGGPMGVYEADRFPFLTDEIALIRTALAAKKPVLGICLGAQLMAAAAGAKVYPSGRQEIGWYPLTFSKLCDPVYQGFPRTIEAFHWHGDTYDLPAGAVRLSSSPMTVEQAFRLGTTAYAFQFHLEVTEQIVAEFAATSAQELRQHGIDPHTLVHGARIHGAELERLARLAFGRWAGFLL